MSQHQGPTSVESQPSNGLAIAGFVCSLIGFLTMGTLSLVGLILSLVALGKPGRRGLAIGGIILGVLGLCGWAIALVIAGASILAALGIMAVGVAVLQAEGLEISMDMGQIVFKLDEFERRSGALPDDLSGLELRDSVLIDPWGNNYRYELIDDEPGFDIISNGEDGQPETDDDIYLSRLKEYWEGAWEDFEQYKREAAAEDADADADNADESDDEPGDDDEGGGDE